jgi:hypothetical protein
LETAEPAVHGTGIEASDHLGQRGTLEIRLTNRDRSHTAFVLGVEAIEHGERQHVIDAVAHVGIEQDSAGLFAAE